MLNQQLISSEIAPLHPDQTVEVALAKMEADALGHLPVVLDGAFVGILAEDDLLDEEDSQQKISALQDRYLPFCVLADEHFYTAASIMAGRHLSLIPVVASNREYVGAISKSTLLEQLIQMTGVMTGGALVVIEMEPTAFSISELSKLVETNDAHITQLNTAINEVSGLLTATMRINKQEVSDIIATLQRYEYHVVYYAGEEQYENELRRNYHHLMSFLNM
ncbi:MAG TPA: CBS domain-containing protein [Phnomibacter sp.]|nr:CBS domain-containing protein [Phnomibacter sp.]